MKKRFTEDMGFSGSTHALSAIGLYLLLTVFASSFIFDTVLGTKNLSMYILSVVTVVGFSLLPDIDNVKSLVISNLGFFGRLLSKLSRTLSKGIWTISKTKYDNDEHNPHRGFFHTFISVIFVGLGIFGLTVIPTEFIINEKVYSVGFFLSVLFVMIAIRLSVSGTFAILNKKNKPSMGASIISFLMVLGISVIAVLYKPEGLHSYWIGYLAGIGYFIHLLGDLNTPAGIPLFFPFKIKGKRWFYIRLFKIESGGTIENLAVKPIFIVMIIYSVIKLIPIFGA